jgi:CubicO group peptidase (beta-lactamase class C family)
MQKTLNRKGAKHAKKIVFRVVFIGLFSALLICSCRTTGQNASPTGTSPPSSGKMYLGEGDYTGSYWPTQGWRTCEPEAVGMNSGNLLKAIQYAATPGFNTEGLAVVRKGHIVGEAYLGDFKPETLHVSHSVAKSFTSALVGIAIDKGLITDVDAKLCEYYDEWDCGDSEDLRSRITLRHAMTLTTGLEWHEDWSRWDPATNDALKMGASRHFITYMSERKGLHEPGQKFLFSTGDPMLLSRVMQEATGMTALEFAKQNMFEPLNMSEVDWDQDLDGYTATAWGLHATVRDYTKFGYLYLNKGRWEERQIVPAEWVETSTRTDPSVRMWDAYGFLWHVNLPHRLKFGHSSMSTEGIPADGYMAEGVLGQNIIIIPSLDLVIVRVANQTQGRMDPVRFLTMILEAIES